MNNKLAIGFDLDGTLWDSLEAVSRSWRMAVNEIPGARPLSDETIKGVMGLPPKGIAAKLFPYFDEKKAMEAFDVCTRFEIEYVAKVGGVLFEGLEETLEYLCGKYPLYIVSNCQKGYIEAFLSYHRLGKYFADTENAENTGLTKGENIRLVMERQGFEKSVYIGDTQGDCDAAREAGVPFIFASYGFGSVKDPEKSIRDIRELREIF